MTSDRARELAHQLVARANVLLRETEASDQDEPASSRRYSLARVDLRGWIPDPAATLSLNVAVLGSATAALVIALGDRPHDWAGYGAIVLRMTVAWTLAFVPGWIFVRYFTERVPAIWDHYVGQLFRLGLDRPGNLPRPPLNTSYYASWQADGGERRSGQRNVYQEKFDAYYGRSVARTARDRLGRMRGEVLTPVLLLTSLLSIGWTALLWYLPPVDLTSGGQNLWISLGLGYLGAYTYAVQLLVRRFMENELRSATYGVLAVYIVFVVVLVAVVHRLLDTLGAGAGTEAVAMYGLGLLAPAVPAALRLVADILRRLASSTVPSLRPQFPLSDLDGMSGWHESRLIREGVEDMQGLVAVNLVDLILHIRIPVARIVDWIDQACLLLHLGGDRDLRESLRRLGIRTATDLLAVFPAEERPNSRSSGSRAAGAWDALQEVNIDQATVQRLVRSLANDPRLQTVHNWRLGEPESYAEATESTISSDAEVSPKSQRAGARQGE
jgi:hypothetical protein